jgi:hypothetical protein
MSRLAGWFFLLPSAAWLVVVSAYHENLFVAWHQAPTVLDVTVMLAGVMFLVGFVLCVLGDD